MGHSRVDPVRCAYGGLLVIAPALAARPVPGATLDAPALATLRVLGLRDLVQALLTPRRRNGARIGRIVDLIHLATALGLAAADGRRRPLALASAAVTAFFVVRGGGRTRTGRRDGRLPG